MVVVLLLIGLAPAAVARLASPLFWCFAEFSVQAPWPGYVVYAAWMVLPCALHAIDEKRFG